MKKRDKRRLVKYWLCKELST